MVTVIVAIAIPEIPRVVRLVRSIVLSIREEPYVEAAISVGTRLPLILIRHVLPNTLAPLIVQGTYVCASAILLEAILSFLGAGIPPEIPTWGNIMAEGRVLFQVYPHNIFFPGLFLALTVLAVNVLGDGLRDTLDPRMVTRFWRAVARTPVLQIEGLTVGLPKGADRRHAVEDVALVVRAGRDRLPRGRIRLGQVRHGPWRDGPAAQGPAHAAGRLDRARRARTCCSAAEGRLRALRGTAHVDDLPGADDRAQPGDDAAARRSTRCCAPTPISGPGRGARACWT